MSVRRMIAIAVIFLAGSVGWFVLGTTTAQRSLASHERTGAAVEALYGAPIVQEAPSFAVEVPGSERVRAVMPVRNDVQVALETDYRKKGLIWHPTYTCSFTGVYTLANDEEVAQKVRVFFRFPSAAGTYDEFAVYIGGEPVGAPVSAADGVGEIIELAPGQETDFRVTYKTRGIREWRYKMDANLGRVRNLQLAVTTGFRKVDYPDGCLSPMLSRETPEGGMLLTWQATDLLTKEDIGITIPGKLNPGPLTSRITFFAPVCLLFFFVLTVTINVLYKVNIHPMHYLFVAAGFFAFHLLMAYMAGLVNIHVAFLVSAAVSVTLVTLYLSAALRGGFPWKVAAAGQLFFLVLFSYSFFLEGITGLTVAVGSVATLAVLMKVTAHVDWDEVFSRKQREPVPPAPDTTARGTRAPAEAGTSGA